MYIRDTRGWDVFRSSARGSARTRLTIRRPSSLFRLGREGSRAAGMAAGRRARAQAHKALVAAGARGPAAAPACRRARRLTCPLVDRVLPRVGVCPGGPRGGTHGPGGASAACSRGRWGRARGPAGRPACPPASFYTRRASPSGASSRSRAAHGGDRRRDDRIRTSDVTPAQCGERAHGRRKTGPTQHAGRPQGKTLAFERTFLL